MHPSSYLRKFITHMLKMPGTLAPFYFSPESKDISQLVISETLGLRKTSDDPPTSVPDPFLPPLCPAHSSLFPSSSALFPYKFVCGMFIHMIKNPSLMCSLFLTLVMFTQDKCGSLFLKTAFFLSYVYKKNFTNDLTVPN